jgi:tetratricopeptide (TPR) repeat protein
MKLMQLNYTGLLAVTLFFIFTATQSRAELPPDAQAAVDKGILAAKDAQDYLLAIRYFQDARKIAPGEPDIYYKLGVAESNIPGRELRAICWLEAYLAVDPIVPNAAAVKKEIDVLDVKSQSNISRLIQSVQDAAITIPIETEGRTEPYTYKRNCGLTGVANLWEETGDFIAAKKAIGLMVTGDDAGVKKSAEKDVVNAQKQYDEDKAKPAYYFGDITSVHEWVRLVDEGHEVNNDGELSDLSYLDFGNQIKTITSDDPYKCVDALSRIVADVIKRQNDVDNMLKKLAEQQAALEPDLSKLQAAAFEAAPLAKTIIGLVKAGDMEGAKKIVDGIQDASVKSIVQKDVGEGLK